MRLLVLLLLLLQGVACAELKTIRPKKQKVDLAKTLVPEKENIVVFHARAVYLSEQLVSGVNALAAKRPDLEFVIIDGAQLGSPVAKQFNLTSLPYVQIYNEKGELKSEGAPAYKSLNAMIEKAGF